MKPDWKDAPDWARWLALDLDGWHWFSSEPSYELGVWMDGGSHEFACMSSGDVHFVAALEARPVEAYNTRS